MYLNVAEAQYFARQIQDPEIRLFVSYGFTAAVTRRGVDQLASPPVCPFDLLYFCEILAGMYQKNWS